MRNGFWAKAENLRSAVRASEQFLGKFAADCLMSRSRALDRIARDLRYIASEASNTARRRSIDK